MAAYYGDVRIATLTREYNCKFRGQGYLNGTVKIAHGHVDFKLDPVFVDKAMRALNASTKPRVYIAGRVYEQKLVGRFADRRKPGRVGTFPLLPEPALLAEAKGLKKIIGQTGMRNLVARACRRSERIAGRCLWRTVMIIERLALAARALLPIVVPAAVRTLDFYTA